MSSHRRTVLGVLLSHGTACVAKRAGKQVAQQPSWPAHRAQQHRVPHGEAALQACLRTGTPLHIASSLRCGWIALHQAHKLVQLLWGDSQAECACCNVCLPQSTCYMR